LKRRGDHFIVFGGDVQIDVRDDVQVMYYDDSRLKKLVRHAYPDLFNYFSSVFTLTDTNRMR
jgi:hypothetical protein